MSMVSVIIPAFNAEKTIGRCLDALTKQDYRGEYEIIVVDDGSTDSTPDIVSKFVKAQLIRQKNAGPAAARNRGASISVGEIILFTDADCVPEPDWISEMLRPFYENSEVAGVKGAYKTKQKEITARFVQLEYEDKYNYMLKDKFIDFIDTYSAGFRKDVFLEMKGYDTSFPVACAEDVELSYRMSNKRHKMVFNPDAVVYHTHPDSLIGYLKKKYKFAYWRMLALKKNPDKALKDSHTPQTMKIQLLFPPLIFASTLLAFLNSIFLFPVLLLITVFLSTTLSFALRALKKDVLIGLLAPGLLFFRASAQFLGVLSGAVFAGKK
ncbi:MAG: glycosyltransferase [Nitrospiraceae bacterium]|nr:MAG: glycosyltransferase [Nitrospiraceae bacterium]